MGTFFKALEQAERERALKEQASRRAAGSGDPTPSVSALSPPPEATVRPVVEAPAAPPSVFQRQKDKEREKEVLPKRPTVRDVMSPAAPEVDAHLVSLLAPTSFGAEQYRALEAP